MPTRTARTAWNGDLQNGSGQVELTSSGVGTYDVSFPKRAAESADGTTSPEELIAAAHSSCYSMALSAEIARAGGTPQSLDVTADVTLVTGPRGRVPDLGDRAHRPRRGRGPRRGRLRHGRSGREGRLPGQQGTDRHHDHAGRQPRLRWRIEGSEHEVHGERASARAAAASRRPLNTMTNGTLVGSPSRRECRSSFCAARAGVGHRVSWVPERVVRHPDARCGGLPWQEQWDWFWPTEAEEEAADCSVCSVILLVVYLLFR